MRQYAGKPIRDCRSEMARVAEIAEYWAGWCDNIEGRICLSGRRTWRSAMSA
jgi:acyl-CoA reductase-like NAD-dependent aldehyde dehydrogenase